MSHSTGTAVTAAPMAKAVCRRLTPNAHRPASSTVTRARISTATQAPVVRGRRLPSQTQMALRNPVCGFWGGRAMYMKRQMIPAPTNEMAMGRKMRLLATDSPRTPSASTAAASPSAVDSPVTTTTHHRLLMTVPRSVVNTANESTNNPMAIGPIEPGRASIVRPRRRPTAMPIPSPTAMSTRAA